MRKPARYSPATGFGAFLICGLLGLVWGLTSVPITAALAAIVLAPFVVAWGGLWLVNLPIALVMVGSLWVVHRIVARAPDGADDAQKQKCASDAIYGAIGFELAYLVAWIGLYLVITNMPTI